MPGSARRPLLRSLALLGAAALLAACAPAPPPAAAQAEVSPDEVRRSLGALAADSLRGRATGSEGAAMAARFIARRLREHGVAPAFPGAPGDSGYFQRVPLARGAGPDGRERLTLLPSLEAWRGLPPQRRAADVNVVGVLRGSDPALRDEAVIVGAHFDHVGVGPAVNGDSIYNGADDDASGVVAVLEIARALAAGPPPARTVVFLLTTGEEQGLLGTRWYVADPVVPLERTVAHLQIEMIGRPDSLAGGAGRGWLTGYDRSTMGDALAGAGVPIVPDPRPAQEFFLRSDNVAFACLGIPAHTLSSFGLHADYHSPEDEVERVDLEHVASVIEAAVRAVRLLADGPAPEWEDGGNPVNDPICGGFR